MCGKRLVDCMTGKVLADKVELAETFWRRFRGLMFRRNFRKGQALLFKLAKSGRYGIHMFFVRFSIDLLYLNQDFVVVDIRRELRPWRIHTPKVNASYIVELPAGTISRTNVKIGHKLALAQSIN